MQSRCTFCGCLDEDLAGGHDYCVGMEIYESGNLKLGDNLCLSWCDEHDL
jgi:hypothetical protein